jgi:hypothetical protein
MTEQEELQRRVRRNAMLLGLLALGFYLAYYFIQYRNSHGG